jgi:hypothetical protein
MGIKILGDTSGASAEVDSDNDALRVSMRPGQVTGAYRCATTNGATGIAAGAGAASEVWAFRNASTTKTALIRKVTMSMWTAATGFTAGLSIFELKAARAFTVGPTAGTTTVLTGNNCKLATDHETCGSVIYVADDSVLTSGTEVANTTGIGHITATTSNATLTVHVNDAVLFDAKDAGHPLEFVQDEGMILYATVPATGVWFLKVNVDWEECLNATF